MGIFSDRYKYDDFEYPKQSEYDKGYNKAIADIWKKLDTMYKDSTGKVLIWKVKAELDELKKK